MVVAASVRVLAGEEPSSNSFLGQGRGHARPQQNFQVLGNQDPVGSPAEVSQTNFATTIIANQIPFKAGGLRDCLHVWKTITSDPFILDAVTHCHIEFDREPGICTSVARPFCSFTEIEQTIIDNEVEKFLL